jgi:hypothetical protein
VLPVCRVFGGTSEQQRDFQAAAAELERIWEVVRTGEHIEASAMIAAQVAMARWLARNSDGARQACDADFAMGQRPHLLVQIAVRLAQEDRRPGDIITLLSRVDIRPMPELDIELASAQAEVGRDDDALRTLTRVAENSEAGPSLRAVARARSIEIRARRGNSFALLDEIVSLVAAEPDIVAYRVVAARLYEELGEHDKALAQANAARELLDQQPTLDNQVSVANLLLDLDEPSDAAEIYAQLAPHPVDSELGRRLLRALLAADSRAALRARLDAMPASEKTDQSYLWIEAALLERIGKLPEAIDLLTAYLRNRPEAAGLRLNWIGLLERLDRSAELRAFLAHNADLPTATPMQQLQYAHVLRRHGFTSEALRLGYEAVRRAMRDPDAHVAYISLVLFTPEFEPFDRDTVGPDQGFVFKSDSGVHRTFVIEAGDPLEQAISLPPNHPIAQAAIGKHVGDRIEIEEGPYSRITGSIVSIRHKYLVLSDDLMENFSHRFPNHTGMFKVAVRQLEGASSDFSELMRAVEDLAARDRSISNQYVEDGLPLPVIAKMLGEHPVLAWGKLSGRRHGIIVCDGNSEEIEAARQVLRAAGGLVMDPITLNLIHELGIEDALVGIGLPLGVTRSTIESLERLIEKLAIHQDGMKSLGMHDDQFVLTEVRAEAMATHLQGLKGLVAWALKHCKEIPAIAETDLPKEARQLGGAIDRSFMDTIIAARARGWVLLADDLHFRRIARLLGVDGVWMQPTLDLALERHALDDDAYNDAVIKLALMNHQFTRLGGGTLLRMAERAGWRHTAELERLLQKVGARDVELRSAVIVVAQFLYGLLLSPAARKPRHRMFAAALERSRSIMWGSFQISMTR